MIALGSTTFVFIGWKIPETTKINGLKTEITSMNFVFAWWHTLNRYLPLPSLNAKGTRGGCNLQGTGCSLSPTIFRSVFFAVNNKLSTVHGPTTVSCQEIGERRLHWTVSELITLYWIELKAKALYDCGVDRIFCQPKWINNSFEDTVMMLEQILRR